LAKAGLLSGKGLNHLFGGGQTAVTYEFQPGLLLAGEIFFIVAISKSLQKMLLQTLKSGGCGLLQHFPSSALRPTARVFPRFFHDVCADGFNQWPVQVLHRIRLTERVGLALWSDLINLQNRSRMNAPELLPTSTNSGHITSQTSSLNRVIQIQARLQL
jgi:hypothetical protein